MSLTNKDWIKEGNVGVGFKRVVCPFGGLSIERDEYRLKEVDFMKG